MSDRTAHRLAWSLCALSLVLVALMLVFYVLGLGVSDEGAIGLRSCSFPSWR